MFTRRPPSGPPPESSRKASSGKAPPRKDGAASLTPLMRIRNMFAPVKVEQTIINQYGGSPGPTPAGTFTSGPAKAPLATEDFAVLAKTPKEETTPAEATHAYEETAAQSEEPDPVLTWIEPDAADMVDKRV